MLVLGSIVGLTVATGAGGDGPGADRDLRLVGERSVVVRPGDSLWSIASSVAGGDDIRDVVHRIQQVNGLPGTGLTPGQVLALP